MADDDRSWMYNRQDSKGHLTVEFSSGVPRFLNFAKESLGSDRIKCPCVDCCCLFYFSIDEVGTHLYKTGFMPNYTIWHEHGETKSSRKKAQIEMVEEYNHTIFDDHHKHRLPRIPKTNLHLRSPFIHGKTNLVKKRSTPLPLRPPSILITGNPLKRKLKHEHAVKVGDSDLMTLETGVQVVVRIKPLDGSEEEEDRIVRKISNDSLSILDSTFEFDYVADAESTQQEIFELVGIPLVENCLSGFNSSIFAYGQSGSGKTYTMWGPSSALLDKDMACNAKGLTPRVFERLFDRIDEEQSKHSHMLLSYQCRCSFLEIYNEQITDLLDPHHSSHLLIREDVRSGVYVENLTEDYVLSTEDIRKLFVKGLANRRCGTTNINTESSRSHCVFTCVIESKSKCMSDGLSTIKTSRINFVDLAGSERQKQTSASGERLKEAGHINRSLSQLGNLINILVEISQSGKQRHVPYRDSRLTFLLQESLGGNAKLAMICTVSSSESCKSETSSTLRFAQRVKAIKNKAIVNEVMRDDINVLREQVCKLKDELHRMQSKEGSTGDCQISSTGWNTRRSLNILRQSLSYPIILPTLDDEDDEEMEIDDEDIENTPIQSALPLHDENIDDVEKSASQTIFSEPTDFCQDTSVNGDTITDHLIGIKKNAIFEAENISKDHLISDTFQGTHIYDTDRKSHENLVAVSGSTKVNDGENNSSHSGNEFVTECISQESYQPVEDQCPSRKSQKTTFSMSASSKDEQSCSWFQRNSYTHMSKSCPSNAACTELRNHFSTPTNRSDSLHHGQLDCHQQASPYETFPVKPSIPATKVDFCMQTLPEESKEAEVSTRHVCTFCKKAQPALVYKDAGVNTEPDLAILDESHSNQKSMKKVPRAVEKVLAGAIRREMAFEDYCDRQASEITHLNRLVQQYKHEQECNMILEQAREDKICRLEGFMDGIIPTDHFMEEECLSLVNEHKLLKDKYENHPEVLRLHIELRGARDELDKYRNFFDLGERDVLMEEIHDLRTQLQYYIDPASLENKKSSFFPQLVHSNYPVDFPSNEFSGLSKGYTEKMFEEERKQWAEAENKWSSACEELKHDLEKIRALADKQKIELDSEKNCLEELKEALRTAMHGHARMLDQYADLQEKHIALLSRHRKLRNGISDVRKAAARAGVKGAELKFIDSLAAEISALKTEREKERQLWRNENKELQVQLRDTVEAVQTAGKLLVRLKEAEESSDALQKRTAAAEKEVDEAYGEIDRLKRP